MIKSFKNYILLITYAVLLYLAISNIGIVMAVIREFLKILAPFILGFVFAYILNILMSFVERKFFSSIEKSKQTFVRKLKRPLAILTTLVIITAFFTVVMLFIIPQLAESLSVLVSNIPDFTKSLERFFNNISDRLNIKGDFWNNVSLNWNEIIQKTSQFITTALPKIFLVAIGFTNTLFNFLISLIAAIYFLSSKEKLIKILKKLIYAYLPEKTAIKLIDTGSKTNKTFKGFIAGQLTEALILGVLVFFGMVIFRFPYALLCSTIIAVTSIIPIFGAWIGIIPSAFIVLMTEPSKTLWFIIFIVILQQLEGNLIYPRVVGNAIGLDGIWVFFAIIVGGSLFGIVGMIFGIPAFAVLYAIIRRITNKRLRERNINVY